MYYETYLYGIQKNSQIRKDWLEILPQYFVSKKMIYLITLKIFYKQQWNGFYMMKWKDKNTIKKRKMRYRLWSCKIRILPFSFFEQKSVLVFVSFEHITDLHMKPRVTPSLEAHFLFPIIPLPCKCCQTLKMS